MLHNIFTQINTFSFINSIFSIIFATNQSA